MHRANRARVWQQEGRHRRPRQGAEGSRRAAGCETGSAAEAGFRCAAGGIGRSAVSGVDLYSMCFELAGSAPRREGSRVALVRSAGRSAHQDGGF